MGTAAGYNWVYKSDDADSDTMNVETEHRDIVLFIFISPPSDALLNNHV